MYNFDKLPNRLGTNSEKWNVLEHELPMWVADMDFDNSPEIKDALRKRVELGAYGYSYPSDEWYESYIRFFKDIHNVEYDRGDIIFCIGTIPALSSIVRKITTPGEKVIILTPVYNVFYNSILNNGRFVLECPLKYDLNTNSYSIDFRHLESLMTDPQATLMVMCNPQNPTGNIWSKEDLTKVLELTRKYRIKLVSDEIHCDIVTPGKKYVPIYTIASSDDQVIVLSSATKCFNLAGIQASYIVVKNQDLNYKVWRGINTDDVGEGNAFFDTVCIVAFNDSRKWLEEVNEYIYQNKLHAYDFIEKNTSAKVVRGDATYLIWVDLRDYITNASDFCDYLRKTTGLYITTGVIYGGECETFVRINLATSKENVKDGLNRLVKALKSYKK